MSRSYKKTPFVKCEKSCKKGKKWANKRVRTSVNVLPHKAYKKLFCSWDICDYYDIMTWNEYQLWKKENGYENPSYYEWFRAYKGK